MRQNILARVALTADGWQDNVCVEVNDGVITSVTAAVDPGQCSVGVLLPAPGNLHSHSFQHAMAGLTESRGPDAQDSFWTWRRLMYRFLGAINPDHIESIAAYVFMQMAEAGYGAVAEFHYLHHPGDGKTYANIAETSERITAAASHVGLGLTLLPVLYQRGGCDDRALTDAQIRFGNTTESYSRLYEAAAASIASAMPDCRLGAAPHSVRAADKAGIALCSSLASTTPLHIHVSEQEAEVAETLEHLGASPAAWLMDNFEVDERWCFIHGTQMPADEIARFNKRGAVFGLCPITEANLGDGIFDCQSMIEQDGLFGVGSDSNVRISLAGELQMLEYSQRLAKKRRALFADSQRSTGRNLLEGACRGGARAMQRNSGCIEPGRLADLFALDDQALELTARENDNLIDTFVFAAGDRLVSDVWSAGRHIVTGGAHIERIPITESFKKTLNALSETL